VHSYLPHTEEDRRQMMDVIGVKTIEELFGDIPESIRFHGRLNLPGPLSEWELMRHLQTLSGRNANFLTHSSFLGAGMYQHYIPSVVDAIISRSEFYTSYTPYQPEITQGMLQAIFEFQSLVCALTGMDVANASMYDGPTAMAEAALMACAATGRDRVLVAKTVHPEYRKILGTYAKGQDIRVEEIGYVDGLVSPEAAAALLDGRAAALLVQYPNFFGGIENLRVLADLAHAHQALLIVHVNPIALGLLVAPGDCGADIVTGEGQPLGNPVSFGGPSLGILAARQSLVRRIPGRIVGETKDTQGRRGYVLTLQAREQHIRREKATSNICSNQALNALVATVYMSCMGRQGMREVARLCYQKAHYAARRLAQVKGVRIPFAGPFFHEFVIGFDRPVKEIQRVLLEQGILGGYDLSQDYPELGQAMLVAVTEVRTKEEIDRFAKALEVIVPCIDH
jgi:glycine dehydrogenase subunit 1